MNKQTYGFRIRFAGGIDYAFDSQITRNKALRQIKAALKQAGLTKADFDIELKQGPRKGRGLRLIK